MLNKIILLSFSIILSATYSFAKRKNMNISIILFVSIDILLSLVFAYRNYIFPDFIGTDYYNYIDWFDNMSFNKLNFSLKNIGFNLLICICKIFTKDSNILFFICSLIINTSILKFIERNSRQFTLSVIIYITIFYFSTFNIMRQWLACSIFLLAFNYIKEGKFFKYILLILISASFHDSAIFLILVYPLLRNGNKNKNKEIVFWIIGIAIYFSFNSILNQIFLFSEKIGMGYLSKYGSKELNYQTGNLVAFIITIFVYILLKLNKKDKVDENNKFTLYLLSLSILFNILNTKNIIFSRYSVYFFPSILLAIPDTVDIFKEKNKMIYKIIITILVTYAFLF